jgi:LuxR family maltose regulon positive regulatory protein
VLVMTKLEAPPGRPGLVARPDLVARLRLGPARLVLVDAPAGWGKTRLLAEWRAAVVQHTAVAWLSLDAADNDPVWFWSYVVEALRGASPTMEGAVTVLVNQLAAAPGPVALVLDDCRAVVEPEIHRGVALLLERLPASTTLVLATRADPTGCATSASR